MDDAAIAMDVRVVDSLFSVARRDVWISSARIGFHQQIVEKTQMQLNDRSLVQPHADFELRERLTPMRQPRWITVPGDAVASELSRWTSSGFSSLSILNYLR